MKEGDFVRIDYVARIHESGEIFDLTKESVAKKEKIFKPDFKYGPVPVIIGANFVMKGLEDEVKKLTVGKKKEVVIQPENAFGERRTELIKMVPMSEFKKQNMTPFPGMFITANNVRGRVLSVSGGRVKVDFNHPLAGKTLRYEVEVKDKITGKKDQTAAVIDFFTRADKDKVKVLVKEKTARIELKDLNIPQNIKKLMADTIRKWVKGIGNVEFADVFKD